MTVLVGVTGWQSCMMQNHHRWQTIACSRKIHRAPQMSITVRKLNFF
jgi:hypothetical protein